MALWTWARQGVHCDSRTGVALCSESTARYREQLLWCTTLPASVSLWEALLPAWGHGQGSSPQWKGRAGWAEGRCGHPNSANCECGDASDASLAVEGTTLLTFSLSTCSCSEHLAVCMRNSCFSYSMSEGVFDPARLHAWTLGRWGDKGGWVCPTGRWKMSLFSSHSSLAVLECLGRAVVSPIQMG